MVRWGRKKKLAGGGGRGDSVGGWTGKQKKASPLLLFLILLIIACKSSPATSLSVVRKLVILPLAVDSGVLPLFITIVGVDTSRAGKGR